LRVQIWFDLPDDLVEQGLQSSSLFGRATVVLIEIRFEVRSLVVEKSFYRVEFVSVARIGLLVLEPDLDATDRGLNGGFDASYGGRCAFQTRLSDHGERA